MLHAHAAVTGPVRSHENVSPTGIGVASHALALHRPTDAIALMDYRRASSRPMPENGPSWCVIAEAHRQLGQLDPSADARCRAR